MTPVLVNRETFLDHLRDSRLLSERQFRSVVARLGHVAEARAIARALVRAGALTKFQAKRLLHGETSGFFVGPFRLLGVLGQGGMGRVYLARHRKLGRTVALKVLAPEVTHNARARALFVREVQAAARLNHPNIVAAYDAGEIDGQHYLSMEHVDGPNLRQLVQRVGPLPVGLACEVVRQVAAGLQHASERGMVHRDIKPANLVLGGVGSGESGVGAEKSPSLLPAPHSRLSLVKILDFGLARLNVAESVDFGAAETIIAGKHAIMGTPDFVSPEQARNLHGVDIRADLYSLGCTFYYLLTGQVPFPGGGALSKLIRHGAEQPTLVETLRPDVSMAVADVVHRLLAKDPAERFQTPMALAEAVAPFADGRVRLVKRKKDATRAGSPTRTGGEATVAATARSWVGGIVQGITRTWFGKR